MKNIRTLVMVLLAVVLVMALAIGCAKKEEAPPATETMEPAATETMSADTTAMMDTTMAAPAEQPQQ